MKVGVIGAGAWGRNHVRNLHEMGYLGAVVEASDKLREELKCDYREVALFDNVTDFLKDSDCSAVVIATPAFTHFDIANQVIDGGKDLLIEKPMTLKSQEAAELVKYARQEGRILMVGHLLLHQPAIRWIKEKLDEGFLGRVFSLHQQRTKLGRARKVENVTWSLGVHDIAVLLYLVNEQPERVLSSGHCGLQKSIEDDVYVHLAFPSGIKAHLHNSWLWPENRRALTIVGEKGMIVYDEINQKVIHHSKSINAELQNCDEGEQVVFTGEGQPLAIELQHFVDCCEQRVDPISDGENGYQVISILEQISEQK